MEVVFACLGGWMARSDGEEVRLLLCVCVHVVVCMLVYSLWTSEIRRTSLRKHRLGLGLEMS